MKLSEPQYEIFQVYCKTKGMAVSDAVDTLISAFLEMLQDDTTLAEVSEKILLKHNKDNKSK